MGEGSAVWRAARLGDVRSLLAAVPVSGAGEAGGCLYSPLRSGGGAYREAEPERVGAEAARRARGKIRRYCAANRLNRLGTLTYAGEGCHDAVLLREHAAVFFRGLRRELGGDLKDEHSRTATTVWRRGYTDDPWLRQEFLAEVRNRNAWA